MMSFFTQNGTNRPIAGDAGSVAKRRYSIRMWKGLYGDNAPAVSDSTSGRGARSLLGAGYVLEWMIWNTTDPVTQRYFNLCVNEGLSSGLYMDEYKYGFDYPEVYAYNKPETGTKYYSFNCTRNAISSYVNGTNNSVSNEATLTYSGTIELRGLEPLKEYNITDYVDGKFSETCASDADGLITLNVSFTDALLLKAELRKVGASIRSNESDVVVNNPASYTVSLEDAKGTASFELSFTFNDDYLDRYSIVVTPLNGFAQGAYPPPVFKYLGQGNWEVTAKYMYILADKFVDVYGPLDVLKISGTAVGTGPATVKITDFSAWGDIYTSLGEMLSSIDKAEATTTIGSKPPKYSKYDLNKDGVIDETDLLYLVYFYQWTDRDPGWNTEDLYGVFAKDCDFQINGRIDLADMIELIAHYGDYDPYA
jgi:hypothetical protein